MRKDRILELAEHIEGLQHTYPTEGPTPSRWRKPSLFNMGRYCGTAACIAGHAVQLFGTGRDRRAFHMAAILASDSNPVFVPMKLLGIESFQYAEDLFVPATELLGDITEVQAAQALRLVAEGHAPLDAWGMVGVGPEF